MEWPLTRITHLDIPLPIRVDEPPRVGIDRLLAAMAANRIRQRDRGAVIVDLGSAMTIDLVDASGAFLGGAILPGIAMSARALAEQTDALPQLGFDWMDHPPSPLGKSTAGAIEAGLYWGAIGAIRELLRQYSTDEDTRPDVFLTGGASAQVVELLAAGGATEDSPRGHRIQHAPNLVLAGIALVDEVVREQ
jgi:type III pantothenate kinase